MKNFGRWILSFFVCGVLSLALANLAGREGKEPFRKFWVHGWPVPLFERVGLFPRPQAPPGTIVIYSSDLRLHDGKLKKPALPAPASWWDFYLGDHYWRIQPEGWIVGGGIWGLLLFGAGVACARSHFVRTGKLQVGMRTVLAAMAAGCLLLVQHPGQWVQFFALPVLTAALVGFATGWLGRRVSDAPAESPRGLGL